ncbi:MGDG synthase family glycosyltransferase [Heyndrickxia acidiproducens]|uniref:MGDG synthase family glycosyltransferase n=1 Tax=Heyndrickxia acidiproducens TaxID=1121084 RepID=UPI00036FD442|nr:hypothetical protein [Heyndrickxia acidiproducens]
MKKILILPLLKIPTGHHQVADTLINRLEQLDEQPEIKKVDLISYTSETFERLVSKTYLKWISKAPRSYQWLYKHFINSDSDQTVLLKLYQQLFIKKMEMLILEEQPDLIICTHSFPSMLLNKLKSKGTIRIPVINAYTDFFVNGMWGKKDIDVHFVPSQNVKAMLEKEGVPGRRIYVTGIPVHGEFMLGTVHRRSSRKKILISGGNSGLGKLSRLLKKLKSSQGFDYYVLCGKNQALYDRIKSWNLKHIIPIPYIQSRREMSQLYDEVDAIITKPGGVTISEVLRKKLPIFIHSALPGQEKVNLAFLKQRGLVFELDYRQPVEKQFMDILMNEQKMDYFYRQIRAYHQEIDVQDREMVSVVHALLDRKVKKELKKPVKDKLYVSTSY